MNILNTIEVDSLRLRIPLSQVERINTATVFNPHLEIAENTGEVVSLKGKGHRIKISDSATIHVNIAKVKTSLHGHTDCLIILLNSKILESEYFNGITSKNIGRVYDKLMASGLFYFDLDTFLNAECTDIDLKFDEVMSEEERIQIVKHTKKMVIPERSDSVKAYTRPTKRNNYSIGIQFSNRSRATKHKPFFKIYSKGTESKAKDAESVNKGEAPFFDTYFNYNELRDVFRLETTIKDKEHAKHYGIESTRLRDVLSISEETKVKVFRTMFSKYLHGFNLKMNAKPKTDTITPNDHALFNAMLLLIKHTDSTIEPIIEGMVNNIENRHSKNRLKEKLHKMYTEHIEGTSYDVKEATKKVGAFFSKFGLM